MFQKKSCREKQNTHFQFSDFFPKIVPFLDKAEKCGGARGTTNYVTIWGIRVACWISEATCTRPSARAPPHTHVRTHAHTQTDICNTYCFTTATMTHCYVIRTLAVFFKLHVSVRSSNLYRKISDLQSCFIYCSNVTIFSIWVSHICAAKDFKYLWDVRQRTLVD
jgi:hypothetical protein